MRAYHGKPMTYAAGHFEALVAAYITMRAPGRASAPASCDAQAFQRLGRYTVMVSAQAGKSHEFLPSADYTAFAVA